MAAKSVMRSWEVAAACIAWASGALLAVALAGVFVVPVLSWWLIGVLLAPPGSWCPFRRRTAGNRLWLYRRGHDEEAIL